MRFCTLCPRQLSHLWLYQLNMHSIPKSQPGLTYVIKIIKNSQAPCSPRKRQCLSQVRRTGQARGRGTEAQDDPGYDKHGNILSGALQYDCDERNDCCPEQGRSAPNDVRDLSPDYACDATSDPERGRIKTSRSRVEMEIIRVRRENVQAITVTVAKNRQFDHKSEERVDSYIMEPSYPKVCAI
jgi:hypothetical protein